VKIVLVNGTMRDPVANEVKTSPRPQVADDDQQDAMPVQKKHKKKAEPDAPEKAEQDAPKNVEPDAPVEKKKSKKKKSVQAQVEQSEPKKLKKAKKEK